MFNAHWGNVRSRARNGMYAITVRLDEQGDQVLGEIQSLDDFPEDLERELDEVIQEAIERMDLQDDDKIGVEIEALDENGNPYPIYIPLQSVGTFSAEVILNTILTVLPSSHSIDLSMTLKFTGLQTDLQSQEEDMFLEGKSSDWKLLHRVSRKSRKVVVIHPDDDPFCNERTCVYQWIALGLAFIFKARFYVDESFDLHMRVLQIDEFSYDKMVRSRAKFNVRKDLGENVMNYLGCQVDTPSLDVLDIAESRLKCNFVLYSVEKGFRRIYPESRSLPIPFNKVGRNVFGIIEGTECAHVNFCSSPSAFVDGSEPGRCCPLCFELFTRSRVCSFEECKRMSIVDCPHCHTCAGVCVACKTNQCGKFDLTGEEDLQYFGRRKTCNKCQVVLFSNRCQEMHEEVCKDMQNVKCMECGRHSHRGLKCDEVRCLMCSEKMKRELLEDHACYVTRDKLKKPSMNYWTYDFETCLDEDNRHVIYLATAVSLFPIPHHDAMDKYEHQYLEKFPEQPVFIFWGLDGVKTLFSFLKEEFVHGTTFFAHNASKYDSVFIEKFMGEIHGELPSKLQRGTKIMQMHYASNAITFKDSLCFISSSLRSMQKDFGVEELKKGYFPHRLMSVDFFKEAEKSQFVIPRPPRDIWEEDVSVGNKGEKEKKEMDDFLDEFYATDELWNMKEDSIAYCISDTLLLAEILKMFRGQCDRLASQVVRVEGTDFEEFDVLQHVTLPSGVMNLFMSLSLQDKTMSVVDRFGSLVRKDSITWVVFECARLQYSMDDIVLFPTFVGITIAASVGSKLFWYVHCYMHGCDKCYGSHNRNFRLDKPFYKLAEEFRTQFNLLRNYAYDNGLQLNVMKSHVWDEVQKQSSFKRWYTTFSNQFEDIIPCDPREAYKGGMTELYKVKYEGIFHIADYVSQYPTSMLGISFSPITGERRTWDLPIGKAEISLFPNLDVLSTDKLGIIKCRVLAPAQLYAPFLGFKVPSKLVPGGYECIYGLCRLCMSDRCNHACMHSNEERSFVGVWTISEVQYALSIGYRVLSITEIWQYEDRSNELFRGFIVPFIREKILASRKGLVEDGMFTSKGLQIKAYLELLTGETIGCDQFQDVPVIRQTAKLMMNSIYGKFGQRAVWPSTSAFTESDEDCEKCTQLLRDTSIEIDGFELIPRKRVGEGELEDEMIAVINYKKHYPCSKGDAKKHDIIAAHITAYGRQMLNEVAQVLGRDMIYSDTDSLAHATDGRIPYFDGYRIGDLELEVVNAKSFLGNGRKSYMYRTNNDVLICKQKGVSLKKSMEPVFSMENMSRMILQTISCVEELQQQGFEYEEALRHLRKMDRVERPALAVDQRQFVTKRNALSGDKITRVSKKYTTFLLEALKRRIVMDVDMIDTLPFGWVENAQ